MHKLKIHIYQTAQEIFDISYTLFKIMIPVIIIVKLLDLMGVTYLLGDMLAPVMELVGLPPAMGIVWATTILTNIYAGMIIFVDIAAFHSLSVADVTVLGSMMLIAHNLPVEGMIAKKAGVKFSVTVLIRVGGGLVYGIILALIYSKFQWLQEPAHILWKTQENADNSILQWATNQLISLLLVQVIIIALVILLKILKLIGIEKIMVILLKPILRLLAISPQCTSIIIIGITLGLSFGGGLLVNEAQKGTIKIKDIFIAITFLGLLHSVIEDTLVILLLGVDINAVLFGRLLFAMVVIAILSRLISYLPDSVFTQFLSSPVMKK